MSTNSSWATAVRLIRIVLILVVPVSYHIGVVDVWCICDGKILSDIGESALLVCT